MSAKCVHLNLVILNHCWNILMWFMREKGYINAPNVDILSEMRLDIQYSSFILRSFCLKNIQESKIKHKWRSTRSQFKKNKLLFIFFRWFAWTSSQFRVIHFTNSQFFVFFYNIIWLHLGGKLWSLPNFVINQNLD